MCSFNLYVTDEIFMNYSKYLNNIDNKISNKLKEEIK